MARMCPNFRRSDRVPVETEPQHSQRAQQPSTRSSLRILRARRKTSYNRRRSDHVALLKRLVFVAVLLTVVTPRLAMADSIITGVVTDTSGAVVPGVTVEASSPALIEQTRSVVTDSNGVYRIVDLRPGPYKVTFTLTGFSTVVRDGIILETDFTATINAQLRVGSVEESITVSGASPVVDVQNTQSRAVISSEQIEQLPSGRSFQSL